MSIGEIILEMIKNMKERYFKSADRMIYFEVKTLARLVRRLEDERIIPLLDGLNIKREINELSNTIIGYEKEHV